MTYLGIKWRYDFNHSKSGVVTFDETKTHHFESLKSREWLLGDTKVEELYEYKNLGVLKNYVGSFSCDTDDNIDKTRKKVVMLHLLERFTVWNARWTHSHKRRSS